MRRDGVNKSTQRGFSLIELLVATAILLFVVGTVMTYISTAQRRFDSEQTKIDMTQESREMMDQIARDLHMVGYPNSRMFGPGVLPNPNWFDGTQVATGIVRMTPTLLKFEGDVDSDGVVDAITYEVVADFPPAPAVAVSCPCRIRRGVRAKQAAAAPVPLNQPDPVFFVEAQGIVNSGNTIALGAVEGNFAAYTAEPVFRAYDVNGTAVPLPVDLNTINPATGRSWVFDIRTIRVSLNVIGATTDNQTRVRPVITMSSTAKVNNF
jgi:prepilin-type N-terminal cleavage/methylation domain-containing protein